MHALALIAALFAARSITSVTIDAYWLGLGEPITEQYVIQAKDADAQALDNLVRALDAPPMKRSEALAHLVDAEWLSKHTASERGCSDEARRLSDAGLQDPRRAADFIEHYYDRKSTDDYPATNVTVQFSDGTTLGASSNDQHAFMLPWKTPHGDSWNPALPRAVAALMPVRSLLRKRLLDVALAEAIMDANRQSIRRQWEDLEERCLHKALIADIATRFTIVNAYRGSPKELAVRLKRDDLPKNLTIDAHVTSANIDVDRMVATVRRYVEAHSHEEFELVYRQSAPDLTDSVLLRTSSGDVVILPNGEAARPTN